MRRGAAVVRWETPGHFTRALLLWSGGENLSWGGGEAGKGRHHARRRAPRDNQGTRMLATTGAAARHICE